MTEQPGTPQDNRPDLSDEALDPANQSLADALRVSFWILKAVMFLLVLSFLGWSRHSGFFTVPPQQQALVLRFGAIKGAGAPKPPGNHWSWPYPIESRVMVDTRVKSFEINTFFFARTEEMMVKSLDELRPRGALKPGQDGYLISGDHNLLHVLWAVEYQVSNVRAFLENIADERQIVKAAFDNAIFNTVAHYKADDVLGDRIAEIQAEAKRRTQETLDRLDAGITIVSTNIKMPTPPLGQVRNAFVQVNNAVSDADRMTLEARRMASRILSDVAGQAHEALYAGIDAYDQARKNKDAEAVKRLEKEIERLLLSDETKGQAGEMIDAARSYKTDIIQAVRAEADYFRRLKSQYDKNPDIVLRRLWENTRQRLLETAKYKVFIPKNQTLVVDVNEAPRWAERERKAALQAGGGKKSE